jgi:hypothetical protein
MQSLKAGCILFATKEAPGGIEYGPRFLDSSSSVSSSLSCRPASCILSSSSSPSDGKSPSRTPGVGEPCPGSSQLTRALLGCSASAYCVRGGGELVIRCPFGYFSPSGTEWRRSVVFSLDGSHGSWSQSEWSGLPFMT